MLNNGFYTALGTPLTEDGKIIEGALIKHIEQQIDAGASGLLLMGSMGIESYLKLSAFEEAVKVAVKANNGRLPLFVGVMDTSIAKVMEKINLIGDAKIDGVVLTASYYAPMNDAQAVSFFTAIADRSPYPLYLYDLAVTVKYKITMPVIDKLINHKNIKGIKTPDWELIQRIGRTYPEKKFECLYSGLDSFDYANMMGIGKNLDGMFSCTPKNAKLMYECVEKGDYKGARRYLDNILLLRDTMAKTGVLLRAFTVCMNLLGCEGNFHRDYDPDLTPEGTETVIKTLKEIGEI